MESANYTSTFLILCFLCTHIKFQLNSKCEELKYSQHANSPYCSQVPQIINAHAVLQYFNCRINILQKIFLFLHPYDIVYKSKLATCQITYCNYLSKTSLRILAVCNLKTFKHYYHYHNYYYYSWFCHVFQAANALHSSWQS